MTYNLKLTKYFSKNNAWTLTHGEPFFTKVKICCKFGSFVTIISPG